MIVTEKSQFEQDLERKNMLVRQSAFSTMRLLKELNDNNSKFWQLPTDRLLAVLNYDVQASLDTIALNTQLIDGLTAILTVLGGDFLRYNGASTTRDDIVFNETEFIHAVLPTP